MLLDPQGSADDCCLSRPASHSRKSESEASSRVPCGLDFAASVERRSRRARRLPAVPASASPPICVLRSDAERGRPASHREGSRRAVNVWTAHRAMTALVQTATLSRHQVAVHPPQGPPPRRRLLRCECRHGRPIPGCAPSASTSGSGMCSQSAVTGASPPPPGPVRTAGPCSSSGYGSRPGQPDVPGCGEAVNDCGRCQDRCKGSREKHRVEPRRGRPLA